MLQTAALILAAGKGTRMHSDKPKVLQTVLGEPMLRYVLEAVRPVFDGRVLVVVGHQAGMVEAAFPDASFVHQEQQLGTGHALMQAMPALEGQCERVLVVNGFDRVSAPLSRHRVQLGLAVGEVPAEPPEIVRLLLVEVVARLHGAALRELTALLLLDRRHLLLRPLQHAHVLRLTAARRAHLLEVHAQLVQRRLQPPHHVLVRHHRELLRRSRYALPLFFSCTVGDALHLRSGHGGPRQPAVHQVLLPLRLLVARVQEQVVRARIVVVHQRHAAVRSVSIGSGLHQISAPLMAVVVSSHFLSRVFFLIICAHIYASLPPRMPTDRLQGCGRFPLVVAAPALEEFLQLLLFSLLPLFVPAPQS